MTPYEKASVAWHFLAIPLLTLMQVVYWLKVARGQPLTTKDVPVVVQHGLLWVVWLMLAAGEGYFIWRDFIR